MMLLQTALLAISLQSALAAWVTPKFPANLASGWTLHGVANNLTSPRSLVFDKAGHLLVLQQNSGIVGLTLNHDGSVASSKTVRSDAFLNHGLTLSHDGRTLYASSNDTVWKWNYNAATLTLSHQVQLITGMSNADHVTRTLLLSRKHPNLLIVARGSNDNLDLDSVDPTQGRAAIKAFDLNTVPHGGYDYASGGKFLSYGTRNEVGLVEDDSGVVWGVENSSDQLTRTIDGVATDVHQDNPGEKLHKFGDAAAAKPASKATWYGYPTCFSVFQPGLFPASDNFKVGDWFTLNNTDSACATATKPKLLFQAHSAPIDIKLGPRGDSHAYVSFHGSWNRSPPTGYKVVTVAGHVSYSGAWNPTESITNPAGYQDLLWNPDLTACPGSCFRPTGLVWTADGQRLYVASDASGEIFLLTRDRAY